MREQTPLHVRPDGAGAARPAWRWARRALAVGVVVALVASGGIAAGEGAGRGQATGPAVSADGPATPTVQALAGPRAARAGVGSAPIGATAYPVPAKAVYVKPRGNSSGAGTKRSPYGSLSHAVDKAPNGSTIVLRGGVYHESVEIPFYKALTIQPFPHESVWMDGSSRVRRWTKSGSTWVRRNWTTNFDHRVSYTQGADESSRWVDPKYPMAGYPDMVWVGGKQLRQVGSVESVGKGDFYVDQPGHRLIIGSNPAGRDVRASTLARGIQVHGAGSTIRGIGIRRFASSVWMAGAIAVEVPDVTLQNLVIAQNATIGLGGWAAGHTFDHLTIRHNGLLGVSGSGWNDVTLSNSVISANNRERFMGAPASGGVKICKSEHVTVRNNHIARNVTAGLWFDCSDYDVTVTGNTIEYNGAVGILFEISDTALIADNFVTDNGGTGIQIFSSGNVQVWNNTVTGNERTFAVWQDSRAQPDPSKTDRVPWLSRNISARNNVFAFSPSNTCPLLTQDLRKLWTGNQFGIDSDANIFHRSDSSAPSNFACWANRNVGNGFVNYKTLKDFAAGTGDDATSVLFEGKRVVDSSLGLTGAATRRMAGVAVPLPADIAGAIGRRTGDRSTGAFGKPY